MPAKPRPKGVPALEKIVVDNLVRLMAFHKHANPTDAAKYVGVSQQQMDRILKGQRARVDTLETIARGYGLEPYQMLIPGLIPGNPQVLRTIGPAEEKLHKAFREALAEAQKGTQ